MLRRKTGNRDETAEFESTAALVAGGLFFADALSNFFLLLPRGMLFPRSWSNYYSQIASHPLLFSLTGWGATVPAVLAIIVVIAVTGRVRSSHERLLQWSATVGMIGFTIAAVKQVTDLKEGMRLAKIYAASDPMTRTTIETIAHRSIDPDLVVEGALIALWFLVVHRLALHGGLPRPLAYLGLANGAMFFLDGAAITLGNLALYLAFLGLQWIVLVPAWFIWTGLFLRKSPAPA